MKLKINAKMRFALIVISLIMAHYSIFVIFPIVYSVYLSFCKWNYLSPHKLFVGLGNYWKLAGDETFLNALRITGIYAIVYTSLSLFLGLFVALMMQKIKERIKTLYETCYFLPVIASMVGCAIIWKYMYDPSFGIINQILKFLDFPSLGWLRDPDIAIYAIAFMSVWKRIGYAMIIFVAGLAGIPRTFYEAAEIDGANSRQMFFRITLPLLKPIFLFLLVVTMITSFQVFTQVWVMSLGEGDAPGGPINSTRVIVMNIYLEGFKHIRAGYASSQAVVLLGVVLFLTLIQMKFLKTKWEY